MFYFFRRGDAVMRCEVRVGSRDGYELVIDRSGAALRVERFPGARELNLRWREFEGLLIRDGWHGPRPCAN
jgi:hypothetical protein